MMSVVREAMLFLYALGAIDDHRAITPIGNQMASFPLEPTSARTLIASFDLGCPNEILSLVALLTYADSLMTTSSNVREQATEAHAKFIHRSGDHLTLLNVLTAYDALEGDKAQRRQWCADNFINFRTMANVLEARKQLRERCDRFGLDWKKSCGDDNLTLVLEACMSGYHQNTAIRFPDGTYKKTISRMVGYRTSRICDNCLVFP